MKWMGGWSWSAYCEVPHDVFIEIVDMINEEAKRIEDRELGHG